MHATYQQHVSQSRMNGELKLNTVGCQEMTTASVNIIRSFFFSSGIPLPYFADTGITGRENVLFRRWISTSDSAMSTLLATIAAGRCESCSLYKSNSCRNDAKVVNESMWEMSNTYNRQRHRSMCRRKAWPSPLFRWAPVINPGMSATER